MKRIRKLLAKTYKQAKTLGKEGFTLVEMLIVISIIGMIFALVGTNLIRRFEESKVNTTKIQMKQLMTVLDDFRRVCGFYPTTDQGLDALVHAPQGRECKNYDPEGFVKRVPKDAWDNDFEYISDGNKFTIRSSANGAKGPDGNTKPLSTDDM
jgi:general secretion pathway protein G